MPLLKSSNLIAEGISEVDQVQIGTTGCTTTRIGFGCAQLVGAITWRESRRLLDCAFDCGIRHFDVAPMYGFAEAESCVGSFLKHHRGQVTITTKFGIIPGRRRRLYRAARWCAAPLLRKLKRRPLTGLVIKPAQTPRTCFDVDAASKSLDNSLRKLGTDHIHVFLLHEASASDLSDDRLLRFLEQSVACGKVGTFGVGSDRSKVPLLLRERYEYCHVTQFQWCLPELMSPPDGSFRILHGIFGQSVRNLQIRLRGDVERCRRWSDFLQLDLFDDDNFAGLVVRASLLLNKDSILLMASKRRERIALNCAAATDKACDKTVERFCGLICELQSTDDRQSICTPRVLA